MRLFRVIRREHRSSAFSGEGARLFGGRWNSKGISVVYASESIALSILETLVNVTTTDIIPELEYFSIDVPESVVLDRINVDALPNHWHHAPPPPELAAIGDAWVKRESSAILLVPSAVTVVENNAILNPKHHDFDKLVIGEPQVLRIDQRLITRKLQK